MKMSKQLRLGPVYCSDASALINITRYPGYPKDVFPTIWKKLESMIKGGELISHVEVFKEIKKRNDPIYQWCKQNKNMFKDIDDCQIKELENIKTKYDPIYWNTEINKGGPWADPWVVALSICEDAIIITDEKNAPNHIPWIANHFDRRCLNLIDFFKEVGIRY
ncbi:MAG: DUF4411 family protein [Methanophagales archaeon ANME-1-THS]|nr:MAG: DUF4411 family protein [Methanophagales archaeon ANME-1-THS]